MIVCDSYNVPINGGSDVFVWDSYISTDSLSSIPRYLETHAERFRSKYVEFIHDLGLAVLHEQSIIDHLSFGGDFSFWWMTKLAEKSPFKSPQIYDCLRVMALEEILLEKRPLKVVFLSSNSDLASVIGGICKAVDIDFRWDKGAKRRNSWSARDLFRMLPHPIRGVIVLLVHCYSRWSLRTSENARSKLVEPSILICSYLIHLDLVAARAGKFQSHQWGQLPKLISELGQSVTWLQHFLVSPAAPDVKAGAQLLELFNKDSENSEKHEFLDGHLTLGLVFSALRRWISLLLLAWRIRDIGVRFYPSKSNACLWPLLRNDWLCSVTGATAVLSCLQHELFDAALAKIAHKEVGFYLCENQGWERAFLHAWRKHGHGQVIGVQHATVPFWHLYYFDDSRSINSKLKRRMPLPDKLAVNGPMARNSFLSSGYSARQLVEVEALRYLSLIANLPAVGSGHAKTILKQSGELGSCKKRVLVLGDMIPRSNQMLLGLLEGVSALLRRHFIFTFKPHPGLAVKLSEFSGLEIDQTNESLNKMLQEFDLAISANSTSAAVDASLAGLPVIIGLDGASLNLSPLRGRSGIFFVSTAEEMAAVLNAIIDHGVAMHETELFCLDSEVPRWRQLLVTLLRDKGDAKC
ncbi:MAG: hypothetical protein K9J74_00310 [Sulfuritalea sp.]|nr:hypothetical protein [Sulfuritalea sp.]